MQAFNRAVLKIAEVEECHMIASRFDYLLKVRTADIQAYRRVLAEQISALPHLAVLMPTDVAVLVRFPVHQAGLLPDLTSLPRFQAAQCIISKSLSQPL